MATALMGDHGATQHAGSGCLTAARARPALCDRAALQPNLSTQVRSAPKLNVHVVRVAQQLHHGPHKRHHSARMRMRAQVRT
eukprot:CAMPEP_0175443642 /NCGR_PEP_ID=MMETSP0095-20121207/58786_1 /TAXON_ID=311494 /ORGANISM="Alexandrium monilatum, Strain CCMP3105" /LENGTH=81 /DNA_ID=CAMNT_0016743743 /DNA_START=21 /DNA_END=264 /DNA_ORIENTATION=+